MLDWVSQLVTAGEGATSPIAELATAALQAPFIYFIGLGLLGATVGILKVVRRG